MGLINIFGIVLIMMLSMGLSPYSNASKGAAKAESHTLTVKITNIRNDKGWIQLQIYKDEKSFEDEKPWKQTHISKKDFNGNGLVYRISGFPEGTYGLALLDDENKNEEMDYKWLMPTEGFGFSDYYHTGWSKPVFNSFKFDFNADKTVEMKIRYI